MGLLTRKNNDAGIICLIKTDTHTHMHTYAYIPYIDKEIYEVTKQGMFYNELLLRNYTFGQM